MGRARSSVVVQALLLLTVVACSTHGPTPAPAAVALDDKGAMPLSLDIPAIGVHVDDLQMFGTGTRDGGDACPPTPDVVSWDSSRPRPGQPGLARLVASRIGAFRRLTDIDLQDPIVLTLSDGRRATFRRGAPVVPDVGSPRASLQLTACGASVGPTVYADLVY